MKNKVVIRDFYNDTYVSPGLDCSGDISLVQQHAKDECDINKIVEKHQRTGVLPVNQQQPVYGDFSSPVEFQEAMNIVNTAKAAFESLDAKVRKQFDNNPAEFLAFVDDPANAEELVKMGLREPKPVFEGDEKKGASEAPPKAGEA